MPVTYNDAGIAEVPIGGHGDIIRTGELFERSYDHIDECGNPRDWTNLEVESAIIYSPVSLASVQAITVDFGVPTEGTLTLSVASVDMPAAGEYRYRIRVQPVGGGELRTLQDGRFTVGGAP